LLTAERQQHARPSPPPLDAIWRDKAHGCKLDVSLQSILNLLPPRLLALLRDAAQQIEHALATTRRPSHVVFIPGENGGQVFGHFLRSQVWVVELSSALGLGHAVLDGQKQDGEAVGVYKSLAFSVGAVREEIGGRDPGVVSRGATKRRWLEEGYAVRDRAGRPSVVTVPDNLALQAVLPAREWRLHGLLASDSARGDL
jgi:hypothetical protein